MKNVDIMTKKFSREQIEEHVIDSVVFVTKRTKLCTVASLRCFLSSKRQKLCTYCSWEHQQ